ncbi:MAG: DUF1800 domain-containing protein [Candidatus Acidiferrales bacterium]
MKKKRILPSGKRMDVPGASLLAALLTFGLTAAVPHARASDDPRVDARQSTADAASVPERFALSKKFKGKLPITELTEDEAILHAMNRLAYGSRPGDVERIRQMGLDKWVEQQLHPESIADAALEQRLQRYPTLAMSSKQLLEEFPRPQQIAKQQGLTKEQAKDQVEEQLKAKRQEAASQVIVTGNDNLDKAQQQLAKVQGPNRIIVELSMAKVDRAIYSNRQLEAVMEDFWFNHFNVFANKGDDKWLLTAYDRDTIRPHAMGKFQDLLLATAKSPAMLFFLDNYLSADPAAVARMEAQKNMRRARYQGAFAGGSMPTPGTFPGPATGPAPAARPAKKPERGLNENYGREVMELHTVGVDAGYTQQDVIQMAECLTGWTIHEPRKDPEFFFDEKIHAQGKKVVMGHTFNYGDEKDGEEALKMLASRPSTGKFISTELARHFVSDNPPPALVNRMAKTFAASNGDIRAVLRTMIYSPEFWSRDAYRSKVKTPFELVASTARALDAEVTITLPLEQWVGRMGEPLYLCQPPTGYSDKAETWVNAGALLNRLNFALAFAGDKMGGATVDLNAMLGDDAARDPNVALARSLQAFLDNQLAPATQATLEARLKDPQILQARLDDPVKQVNEGLIAGLVLGTPEFQRR